MAGKEHSELVAEQVGGQVGGQVSDVAWLGPRPPRTHPSFTDTLDSTAVAGGGGDVVVSPEELDRYTASLQAYVDRISATVAQNQELLARQDDVLVLGPQITGVAHALDTAAATSDHLMRTLMQFHEALSHDVAAVQAARQSYVGTDEDAAHSIGSAGGAAI